MAQINSIAGRYRNPVSGGGQMPTRFTTTTVGAGAAIPISAAALVGGNVEKTPTGNGEGLVLPTMAAVRAAVAGEVDTDSFTCTIQNTAAITATNQIAIANNATPWTGYDAKQMVVQAGTSGIFLIQFLTSTTMSITRVG